MKNIFQERNVKSFTSFLITGSLRPYLKSAKREVPRTIGRPDYADDPNGFPHSEQKLRGSTSIKCLSDEEIEGMRVACKVPIFIQLMHILL